MMKRADMKRISPALILLVCGALACGTGSHVQPVNPDLKVYRPAVPPLDSRHSSSKLDRVAPGTWARYHVASDGNEATVTLGAVRVEGKSLWVEVVEEGDPRKASLRRITFAGEVASARYQEIPASGAPSEVADQPVSPGVDPGSLRGPPARVKEEKRMIKVGDRTIEAKVYRKVYRDEAVGREYEEEEAWSTEVPPLQENLEIAGETAGLIYRKTPSGAVDLVDWGTGYAALVP